MPVGVERVAAVHVFAPLFEAVAIAALVARRARPLVESATDPRIPIPPPLVVTPRPGVTIAIGPGVTIAIAIVVSLSAVDDARVAIARGDRLSLPAVHRRRLVAVGTVVVPDA